MHSANNWKYHIARYFFNHNTVDRQAEICDVFTYDMGYEVVEYAEEKNCNNRHTSVVAVRTNTEKVEAFIIISLVIERKINGELRKIFGYKIMPESDCPIVNIDCPKLISQLSPTNNPFAIVWRGICGGK